MDLSPMVVFAIILFTGTGVSYLSKRFRITGVPMFIVIGIIMAGLGIEHYEGLSFIGDLGLLMIVFIAGLDAYTGCLTTYHSRK